MRLHEFVNLTENASIGATASGSIATVSAPLGPVQRRIPDSMFVGKYTMDSTPNTPDWMKKLKEKSSVK